MTLQKKETKKILNIGDIKILNKKLSVYAEQALECATEL